MSKRIDFMSIRITVFFILIAWTIYFTDSLLWGLIIGIALFIAFNILYNYYEKKKKPYTYSQLAFHLAICDNSLDIVSKLLPDDVSFIKDNNIIVTKNELIYTSFGFSPFSMSDTLKAIRAAKSHNLDMLTIVTTEIDKRIYSIITRSKIKINIINVKHLMRLLLKKNILPDLKSTPRKIGNLGEIFNRQTAGRLLLCGCVIAIMSIVMPIKLYYLIISLICLILAVVCFINPKKKDINQSIIK